MGQAGQSDEWWHKQKRTFAIPPAELVGARKSFISGLFRAADTRYMNPALYQSWSLHFNEKLRVAESVVVSVLLEYGFLVLDAVAITLKLVITGEAAVECCDLAIILRSSKRLSVIHFFLLSDSLQAVLHIRVLLRRSQAVLCYDASLIFWRSSSPRIMRFSLS